MLLWLPLQPSRSPHAVTRHRTQPSATRHVQKLAPALPASAKLASAEKNAAKLLEFEHAAYLRDKIKELKGEA